MHPTPPPPQELDVSGVGELIKIAVERGRAARPGLHLGICGEHGGDPKSIEVSGWCWIVGGWVGGVIGRGALLAGQWPVQANRAPAHARPRPRSRSPTVCTPPPPAITVCVHAGGLCVLLAPARAHRAPGRRAGRHQARPEAGRQRPLPGLSGGLRASQPAAAAPWAELRGGAQRTWRFSPPCTPRAPTMLEYPRTQHCLNTP